MKFFLFKNHSFLYQIFVKHSSDGPRGSLRRLRSQLAEDGCPESQVVLAKQLLEERCGKFQSFARFFVITTSNWELKSNKIFFRKYSGKLILLILPCLQNWMLTKRRMPSWAFIGLPKPRSREILRLQIY